MKGNCTLITLLLFLCHYCSLAQHVNPFIINVTGYSATHHNYRFDWSVGELCIIDSYNQPSGILENGFLHPGTERKPDSIDFFAKGDIMIFPNPVYTIAEINLLLTTAGQVRINMFDVLGRQVLQKEFTYNGVGRTEKLNMEQYRAGTYFLYLVLTPADPALPQRKGVYKITHLTN